MDGSGEITEFRAAQYVRMSTEHQQYSTHNQSDKIREYAEKRGIEIIKTYADDGKSGLSIGGRAALQQLIADVESGAADFNVILVYDVSRWGRLPATAPYRPSVRLPAPALPQHGPCPAWSPDAHLRATRRGQASRSYCSLAHRVSTPALCRSRCERMRC